mgnify:CR=1 FL=1
MKGRKIEEMGVSSRGMYMRNITSIIPKWEDIRIADIIPNRDDICSTADILEFNEMLAPAPFQKLYKIKNGCEYYGYRKVL